MIRAIIVDDEAPARSELRFQLEGTKNVEVVSEAANVKTALEQLKEHGADVMFLDINMPGLTGLQLGEALMRLRNPPAVVFVTAYGEHGAAAFDVNAVDYLLKPVDTSRLLQALSKVTQYLAKNAKLKQVKKILVEKAGCRIMIPTHQIHFIMARDDYSYIHTEEDRYISSCPLSQFENELEEYGFFRVHRRYLVNLESIRELIPVKGGGLILKLHGEEEEISVSRRRVTALKNVMKI
jgi:two-component system response regulator LytT